MKVLIVDRDLGTHKQVRDIVLQHDPEAEIQFSETGIDAFYVVTSEEPVDVIIISNHLDGMAGANVLQAIFRCDKTPTLFHSTYPEGYMEVANGGWAEVDLEVHAAFFPFATFEIKDRNFSYIEKFLLDVKIALLEEDMP